jgi:hypothetical protein
MDLEKKRLVLYLPSHNCIMMNRWLADVLHGSVPVPIIARKIEEDRRVFMVKILKLDLSAGLYLVQ